MPNWTNYSFSYDTGTSTNSDFYVTIPYFAQQVWEAEQERRIEERKKTEELAEDKRKYPLFFLKKGIV